MKKLTASTPRRNHTNGHTPTNRVAPRSAATTPSAKPGGELAELRTQLAAVSSTADSLARIDASLEPPQACVELLKRAVAQLLPFFVAFLLV